MVKEEESDGFMVCINHYTLSDLCLNSLYLFVLFNSMNLLKIPSKDALSLGLDKICFAKFEQNGQPKERSNSSSKMGCKFLSKKQNGQRMSFEFLYCMALATSC